MKPQNDLTFSVPFGMALPKRNFEGDFYRYGFQNQEKEKEITGTESHSFFKYRISDNRLGRFFSVDPLAAKYPHNSTYAFSENRVIDGIELEGLEYYSVLITEVKGQAPIIKIVDHTKTKQGYGTLGPGVDYVWTNPNKMLEVHRFEKNLYGVYQGSNNPKKYWEKPDARGNYPDWYGLSPIDETDANAMQHDLDYDKDDISGPTGVLSKKSTFANLSYVERADKTISKYYNGKNDDITGKPVTKEAKDAAEQGKAAFSTVEIKTRFKISVDEFFQGINNSINKMVTPSN